MRTVLFLLLLCGSACTTRAIRQAHVAVQAAPDDADAWAALGEALGRVRRLDQAQRAFAKALELDPENERALQGRASLSSGAWRLERRAQNNPMDDEVWGDLADRYVEYGQTDLAISTYRYAHELDPGDTEWVAALQALGAWTDEDGTALATDAVVGSGADEAIGDQADAHRATGDWDAACELYRKANALDPTDSEWIGWLATCDSLGARDLSGADLDDLEAALAEDLDLLVRLGQAHADAGHKDRAIAYLRDALLLRPDHRDALHGLLRLEGGTAVDVLTDLATDADTPAAWRALADARLEAGDAAGADAARIRATAAEEREEQPGPPPEE